MVSPDEYTVRLIDLPPSVGGSITESPDGHVNIYINARLSRDGQRRAFDHEMTHLRNGDLHGTINLQAAEAIADRCEIRHRRTSRHRSR